MLPCWKLKRIKTKNQQLKDLMTLITLKLQVSLHSKKIQKMNNKTSNLSFNFNSPK